MRKILSYITFFVMSFSLLSYFSIAFAADSAVVWFEITAPAQAKVNEAIDVTVRAIDKDKKTVTNYKGSIIFISDTFGDTVPSPGKAISFTQEDAWQKKFSKGVIFRSSGNQKIYVADVDNSADITWETTISVQPADTNSNPTDQTETVVVVTPAQNTKITSDNLAVSGKTKKNSKVSIILNGKEEGTSISDENGLFTKTISSPLQEKNILKVNLLDGSNVVIASSDDVAFEKTATSVGFSNFVINPSTVVETSTSLSILLEGEPGLTAVSATLDNSLISLTESSPGKYTSNTVAPAKPGIYPIDVSGTTTLGQLIEKKGMSTLVVSQKIEELHPAFSQVKAIMKDKRVTLTFSVKDAPKELDKFKIAYGENTDSLTNESITYSSGKIQWSWWVYSWYIDLPAPKPYVFKIFGLSTDGSIIQNLIPEIVKVATGDAACMIGAVGDITVVNEAGKSILTWKTLTGAQSYNIYRITSAGDEEFVKNVTEAKYVIYQSWNTPEYNDFTVKALCQDKKESADASKVSRVQTGPEIITLLLIISSIVGVFILRKKALS